MTDISYAVSPLRLSGKSAFLEASKEELRVLLLLIENGGKMNSVDEISALASISVARCRSALAFWEESGIIVRRTEDTPAVMSEFDEIIREGEINEVAAVEVAESIRDNQLAVMFDEIENLLGKGGLSQFDVKELTALYTQYALSADYVVTLAYHLKSRNALTVKRLFNEAKRLADKGCDNTESLDVYLKEKENSSSYEWEFRRVMGIYGKLSESQKKYFKKWAQELEYSTPIVAEAYDISVMNIGKGDLRYMDRILSDWHSGNCKTLSECKAYNEAARMEKKAAKQPRKSSKSEAPTPKYGNFDVNDAFAKALERSYGEKD